MTNRFQFLGAFPYPRFRIGLRAAMPLMLFSTVILTAQIWGNLEAVGVLLLLTTVAGLGRRVRPTRVKVSLLSIWICAFVLAGAVAAVALGKQTPTRKKVVLGLYDLNCSAPFPTYRYPRDVYWLADDDPYYYGSWNRVLVCESWIK